MKRGSASVRTVVDSCILFTAAVSPTGASAKVLEALKQDRFVSVTSAPLLEELGFALTRARPGERYFVTDADAEALIALLHRKGEMIRVTGRAHGCRDPNDDVVIETAIRSAAVCIVTSDEDLTDDEQLRKLLGLAGLRVLTAGEFLKELGE